jgi:hypothetical protein
MPPRSWARPSTTSSIAGAPLMGLSSAWARSIVVDGGAGSMSRSRFAVALTGAAVLAGVASWSSARGQESRVLATVDLMKCAWKYAPCKQIKEGNRVGFTWVADGWKKQCDETADNGWTAIDHLPMGKGPEEVMQVGVSCGWFRRVIELPTKVGAVDVTEARPFLIYTVDDYAETWIDGKRDIVPPIGKPQPWDMKGFNVPVVVELTAKPYGLKAGDALQLAVFAVNGPIANPYGGYWFRECRIEFRK